MEKKNGITYENGLPTSTNGSWQQSITYLLAAMQMTQEELLEKLISNSGTTGDTQGTVTIVKTEVLPQQTHVELYNPFPNIKPIKIEAKRVIVQCPPRVIHKPMLEIYERCCGTYESHRNTQFENCKKRVNYCYNKVNQERGLVTMNDMTMTRIKLLDCGCSVPLNTPISDKLPRIDIYK
jgi:hypothetical protein